MSPSASAISASRRTTSGRASSRSGAAAIASISAPVLLRRLRPRLQDEAVSGGSPVSRHFFPSFVRTRWPSRVEDDLHAVVVE
jgi:hypothetical protein